MKYTIEKSFLHGTAENGTVKEKTVLDYLKQHLRLSSGMITRLKKIENGILLNGKKVTVREKLRANDILDLKLEDMPEEENANILPAPIPIDILYEDDDVIAINKPAGIPTHPSRNHFTDTLANGLAYHYERKGIPFVFRAVNRLDRDTSGIVLVAKNRTAAWRMSQQMQEHRIKKTYISVIHGIIEPESGEIHANIKRKLPSIIERHVCPDNEGDYACTKYKRISCGNNSSMVEVYPITGRTHQIRVHFAHIGHPLIGDTLYGTSDDSKLIGRQALHCSKLQFFASDGSKTIVEAPLPEDIKLLTGELFK